MENQEIEQLLARYYEGTTGEKEEKRLKDFFAHGEVPPHLQAEKDFFVQLATENGITLPDSGADRLCQQIDRWETHERMLKRKGERSIGIFMRISSIAACLLLVLSVGWFLQRTSVATPKDTCSTPEEAYAQMELALSRFSSTFHKGFEEINTLEGTTTRIRESVHQQLKPIENL